MYHVLYSLRRMLIPVLLAGGTVGAVAQDRDTQLWTEVGLSVSVAKRTDVKISEDVRLDNDVSSFRLSRTTLGLEYKLLSFLEILAAYRITFRPDEMEHSVHFNSTAKTDVGPLELSWRMRLLRDVFPDREPQDELRNKFTIEFEQTPAVKPYIASEIYYTMKRDEPGRFDRFRWYAGLKRDIDDSQRIEVYYLYQRELNKKSTEINTILGLGYSISL